MVRTGFLAALAWLLTLSASAQEVEPVTEVVDEQEGDVPEANGSEEPVEAADAPGRAAYFRGLQAADEQRWDDALAAFEESFRASDRTPLLLNIAVAQQALARYVAAAASLELLQSRQDVDAATFRAAEALRGELDERIAVLVIERPEGSSLRVDALPSEANRISVNPGTHVLVVEQEGFLAFRREVEALPGQVHRVSVTLLPRETIEVDPRRRRRRIIGVVAATLLVTAGAVVLGVLLGGAETAATPACPPRNACFEIRP